jgi:PBSX family phage terminase large subunit
VFFKRYILGLWVMAEGVIYDMFSDEKHVKELKEEWDYLFVSCDYGTQNPSTFGLFGVKGKRVHQIRSYYYDGRSKNKQKTDSEYAQDMVEFIGIDKRYVKFIIVDPSAASFIAELKKSKYNLPKVKKANNDVLDGIRTVATYLTTGLFTLDPNCEMDIREFGSYLWDEKAQKHGEDKPIKQNDHAMDKIRYAIYTVFGDVNKTTAKTKSKPKWL